MEIIFLDENSINIGDINFSSLEKLGKYKGYSFYNKDEISNIARNAEVLIVNKVKITSEIMEKLPKLKLISIIATGYNNVDTNAAKEFGITICNVPGYAASSVAQHTFALILNLATKVYLYYNDIMEGKWNSSKSFTLLTYPTFNLAGKTIGIIGFGTIGREVAKIADAFNMKILLYDVQAINDSNYTSSELENLLLQSDIVTLHCPLTDKNRHMINHTTLSKMKRSAFIINTSRGLLIDEQALYQALESGQIAGAGLDVLSNEPPTVESKLLKAKNIILSPHSAWSTIESRQLLIDETAANIKAFIAGKSRNVIV